MCACDCLFLIAACYWQGTTGRRIGELRGHTSSVTALALDEKLNHVFSLSMDKTIKLWDLRNHKCLQTIAEVWLGWVGGGQGRRKVNGVM